MPTRYAGINNHRIITVSDKVFSNKELVIVELPKELEDISSNDLIQYFSYRDGRFSSRTLRKPAKEQRVAFVCNFGQRCGIATYSKFLIENIIGKVKDYVILAEDSSLNADNFNDTTVDKSKIIYCWKRGESLLALANEVKKFDPDVVQIQNEPGLFPNARYLMALLTQISNYRVITTAHSVYRHLDKTIAEAPMGEIIVHSADAAKVLKEDKKVSAKITVIQHGCFTPKNEAPIWNNYKSNHTFIQQGFLFAYKNFEASIKACAILKETYPDVFLTCIGSTGNFSSAEHDQYWNKLLDLIETLGVQDNVGMLKGYQSDTILNIYLRMNKAAVFPYQSNKDHECFGSSGAAPFAMAHSLPVITSTIPHFTDLPTIKVNTPEEMAAELDKLFSDPQHCKDQIAKQNKYLEENSWEKTAQRYIEVFEK